MSETGERSSRGRCFVYLAKTGPLQLKIGLSANPKQRMAQLATSSPLKVHLEHSWKFKTRPEAEAFEKALHRLFRWSRLAREWFAIDPHEARGVGDLLAADKPDRAARLNQLIKRVHHLEALARGKYRNSEREMDVWRARSKTYAAALDMGMHKDEWDEVFDDLRKRWSANRERENQRRGRRAAA